MITSVRNRRVAQARRLHRSSVRRQEGLTLLEGPRLVSEGAEAGLLQTVFVATNADVIAEHAAEAASAAGAEVLRCSPHVVSAASDSHSPQGIVAIGHVPHVDGLAEPALILVIDGVQDPGNLGALIRTGAAAGASMIFRSPGSADPFSPKAMRAGAGAQFRVPIRDTEGPATLPSPIQTIRFHASAADGEINYDQIDWTEPSGVVVGAETRGVSTAWLCACLSTVRVPLHHGVESLNAAAAAAVILFEAARQRTAESPIGEQDARTA